MFAILNVKQIHVTIMEEQLLQNNQSVSTAIASEVTTQVDMTTQQDEKSKQRRSIRPRKESDIISTSRIASVKWKASGLTLAWVTPENMQAKTEEHDTAVSNKQLTSSGQSPAINEKKLLDQETLEELGKLKGYIIGCIGKKGAFAYFPLFGMEYNKNSGWRIPGDLTAKLRALEILITGFDHKDLTNIPVDVKATWISIKDRYTNLGNNSTAATGEVSKIVAEKKPLKDEITDMLDALILLVQCNYPKTYVGILREWGFTREKF